MDYQDYRSMRYELDSFFEQCQTKHYPAKSYLARQYRPMRKLYFIHSGSVAITREHEQDEIILEIANHGRFLCEEGVFLGEVESSTTLRARTDCMVSEISYDRLLMLSQTKLKATYPLLVGYITTQLSARVTFAAKRTEHFVFKDVPGRIAEVLKELASHPDAMRTGEGIELKITRLEISQIAGCSREMAGRTIQRLCDDGVIWAKGKRIVLLAGVEGSLIPTPRYRSTPQPRSLPRQHSRTSIQATSTL